MLLFFFLLKSFYFILPETPSEDKIRVVQINDQQVRTTYDAGPEFIGKYAGKKDGFLILNEDGTGAYKYDIFGFGKPGCTADPIQLEWGFILDQDNRIISFERAYGLSFPVILKSTGANSFKGCSQSIMIEYLLVYTTGQILVSSSDDWVKLDTDN